MWDCIAAILRGATRMCWYRSKYIQHVACTCWLRVWQSWVLLMSSDIPINSRKEGTLFLWQKYTHGAILEDFADVMNGSVWAEFLLIEPQWVCKDVHLLMKQWTEFWSLKCVLLEGQYLYLIQNVGRRLRERAKLHDSQTAERIIFAARAYEHQHLNNYFRGFWPPYRYFTNARRSNWAGRSSVSLNKPL